MKNIKIINARREAGLTQEELAKKIGQKISAVARWEAGVFKPTEANLKKIAEATGKPLDYFLQEDNSVNQQANGNSGNVSQTVNNADGGDIEGIRQELRETRESLGDKIKVLEAKLDLILEKLRKGK